MIQKRIERASGKGTGNVQKAVKSGDVSLLKKSLNPRQKRFAEEYVIDFKGMEAAIRAGYAPKWADCATSNLLRHEGIAAYIDSLTRSAEAKKVVATPEYIEQRILSIINDEIAKHGDQLRGLELLARIKGMFIDKQEIMGKDGGPIQTVKIEQDAQNFTNLLKQLADRANKSEPKEPTRVP